MSTHVDDRCGGCDLLQPMERPRFFTGMLLTEGDLNGEQSYLVAKARLRNRLLLGWGIVCGLEVEASGPGSVTVRSGYALDPCGNDVVLSQDEAFDAVGAIQAGEHADVERWCLTLDYVESETQPVTALRTPPPAAPAPAAAPAARRAAVDRFKEAPKVAPAPAAPVAAEPTRIVEGHRLGVVPCGPEPRADRLVLACLRVDLAAGKIVAIERHDCRRYTGCHHLEERIERLEAALRDLEAERRERDRA
jgi:hypothetical protein